MKSASILKVEVSRKREFRLYWRWMRGWFLIWANRSGEHGVVCIITLHISE
jgi:hypothetical protein